uniref:Phosphatidylinositol 4-kinase type 2 n=1 Tax=Meloidogyne javanica TaxID=6303 RepID=A0A915MQX9_MELJA
TFEHVPCEIGAEEAEEVGVEHLLRDIKNSTAGTLSQRITNQFLGLVGFQHQLAKMALYAKRVVNKELPVNHSIIYHFQEILNLLPDVLSPDFVDAHNSMSNDQAMRIYLGNLARTVIALDDLIDNKLVLQRDEEKSEKKSDSEEKTKDEIREKPTTSNGDHTKSEVFTTSHPLVSDSKNISDPQIISKWMNEFLSRPEPPRFFRPLCNRLARQNQILQELEQKHHDNTKKIIAEAKRRMEMSIRQTRDEQKVQLKEKRKKIEKNEVVKIAKLRLFSDAVTYTRVPSMQENLTSDSVNTTLRLETDFNAESGDDETQVFIKSGNYKKEERTPLLPERSPTSREMSSPDEAGIRSERVNTLDSHHSDEEISRMCNEQYGTTIGTDFADNLAEAIRAINHEIYPERIAQGSSGSYFVKNLKREKIAVFKPKNEEPYGSLNPKWIKWLHKLFFPCCFGRSCLVPNQGYLSEAGASLVDQKLGLNVVPKTAVVSLAAPTFNYSRVDRAMTRTKERIRDRYPDIGRHFRRIGLPPKRGSFQLFVNGYQDAAYWLRQWELFPEMAPPTSVMSEFQLEFEKMVILDYLIRNTDRGNDNWLIKYEPVTVEGKVGIITSGLLAKTRDGTAPGTAMRLNEEINSQDDAKLIDLHEDNEEIEGADETLNDSAGWESVLMPNAKIAAIDNGLAFPFKHPDQWRAYPYQWVGLSIAQRPFSDEIVNKVLPLVDNTDFVRELGNDLRKIFEADKGFDKKTFAKQLSVIRGQMFNLREALRARKSPAQLVQMTPQYMIEIKRKKLRKFRKLVKNIKSSNSQITTTTELTPSTTNLNQSTSGKSLAEQPRIQDNGKFHSFLIAGTSSSVPINEAAIASEAMTTTEDEYENPKSWHNTFKQKVQTRSPFFVIW